MANEQMVNNLESMEETLLEKWQYEGCFEEKTDEEINEAELRYSQAYAQICTAIAALNAPKPFIQIGRNVICKADIIRAEIYSPCVSVYTRQLEADDPDITSGSSSKRLAWHPESTEGKALLGWLQSHSEILVPYEEAPAIEEEED